jgi:hypothetical protein
MKRYILKTFWLLSIGVVNPDGFILDADLDPTPDPTPESFRIPFLGEVKRRQNNINRIAIRVEAFFLDF